jgi:hypothetical protein
VVELEVHQLSPFRLERYPLDILDSKTSMYITAPSIDNNPVFLSRFSPSRVLSSRLLFLSNPRELDVERSRRAVLRLRPSLSNMHPLLDPLFFLVPLEPTCAPPPPRYNSFPEDIHFVLFIFCAVSASLDSLSTCLRVTLSPDKSRGGYFAETQININGRLLDIALYKTRTFFRVVIQYASYPAYYDKDASMNQDPGVHGSPEDYPYPPLSSFT